MSEVKYQSTLTNQKDVEILKSQIYDDKYLGNMTFNTILHIFAYSYDYYKKYINEITESISKKPEFINVRNAKGRTPLIESLVRANYDYANFLLTFPSINLEIRDGTDFTALSVACERGEKDMIIDLLLKGARYTSGDLDKISDKALRKTISDALFFPVINNSQPTNEEMIQIEDDKLNFKIFNQNDLIIDQKSKVGAGSYGTTFPARIKETGELCIVKKFKSGTLDFLDSSQIRDIVFLNMLQPLNTTVKIYGVYIDPVRNLYIVLESLKYNLRSFFEITFSKENDQEKKDMFRDLLKIMLHHSQANSNAGFIHCDSKDDNLMFDSDGNLKYIDYGFAYFLGVIPFKTLVARQIHEGVYVLKDGFLPGKEITVFANEKELFKYTGSNVGLNFDLPTLAKTFLYTVNGKVGSYITYFTHNSKYYVLKTKQIVDGKGIIKAELDLSIEKNLIQYYGKDFTDILTKMLELDQRVRKSSTELLSSEFFGGTPLTIPNELPLTKLKHDNSDQFSKVSSLNFSYNQSSVNTILPHVDNVIKYYSKQIVKSNKFFNNQEYASNVSFILRVHLKLCSTFDVLFNAIMLFNEIVSTKLENIATKIEEIEKSTDTGSKVAETTIKSLNTAKTSLENLAFKSPVLMTVCYFHYLPIFDDKEYTISDILSICFESSNISKTMTDLMECLMLVRKDKRSYIIKPVSIYITYIQYILQTVFTESRDIEVSIIKLISRILKTLVYSDIEVNIFELVKAVYYASSTAIDINLQYDSELVEKIKDIIKKDVPYILV